MKAATLALAVAMTMVQARATERSANTGGAASVAQAGDPCAIRDLQRAPVNGIVVYSPDGSRYLINQEDANGVGQIYLGVTGSAKFACVSCTQVPGGPRPDRYKLQPGWHPSGRWFFVGVERDTYITPPILGTNREYVEGQLRSGLWTNMWVVSPDGAQWVRLTDFQSGVSGTADGFTGPALTSDGKRAVWSQIIDGNIFAYTFGRWQLVLADVDESAGFPRFVNLRDITPPGMHWNEPGNFHRDNRTLLLSGSVERDAQGMDQYLLDVTTNITTNLTQSPTVWDEHGWFSPNGQKIIFMSAYPYRSDPGASKVLSIRTEFMMMNIDGSELVQLTHFRAPGFPESYQGGIAANPVWHPDGGGASLRTLMFPDYVDWVVRFQGACGGAALSRGLLPTK